MTEIILYEGGGQMVRPGHHINGIWYTDQGLDELLELAVFTAP
jgi:hypothetical protein